MKFASQHTITKLATIFSLSLICSSVAFANHHHSAKTSSAKTYNGTPIDFSQNACTSCNTRNQWYVGANLGVSHTHDSATPGSGNSVTQIGPGWSVDLGYQFAHFYKVALAGELGFIQYHQSSENTPGTNVANTEHFSTYAAAAGQLPLVHDLSLKGKLGMAYSYAKKVFTAGGGSASANAYNLYFGAGLSYAFTKKIDMDLQWSRARGNGKTGSTDLTSLGFTYKFA